jgi:electron transfer flavoprotein beta subunit
MPCVVSAVKTSIHYEEKRITVESELEGGMIETVTLSIPCLITVQTGLNQPRYPSLSGKMKAKGLKPAVIYGECLKEGFNKSDYKLEYPDTNVNGIIITGTTEEKAVKLMEILHERGLLL